MRKWKGEKKTKVQCEMQCSEQDWRGRKRKGGSLEGKKEKMWNQEGEKEAEEVKYEKENKS